TYPHGTPHDRSAFFGSMAVVCNRHETPPPRRRVPSRSAGAQPGVSSNGRTSRPCAHRGRDVIHPAASPRDVGWQWHSTCTSSTEEPGCSEARPTLPALGLRGQEHHTGSAACAGRSVYAGAHVKCDHASIHVSPGGLDSRQAFYALIVTGRGCLTHWR